MQPRERVRDDQTGRGASAMARRPTTSDRSTSRVPDRREPPALTGREVFLDILTHELRTPVTTIYGGAQLLATRDLSESRRRAVAR